MPIIPPKVPGEITEKFVDAVKDFYWMDPNFVTAVMNCPGGIGALPVWTLTLSELVSAGGNSPARRAGWRVFARTQDEAVAADVVDTRAAARVTGLSRGPRLAIVIDTVLAALKTATLPDGVAYDPILLRLSSTGLEVCWLKSRSGTPDFYIPTVSGLDEFKMGERYDDQVFVGVLTRFAHEVDTLDQASAI